MEFQSFNQPIVIDNGSAFVKAGFAGEDKPKAYFPTCLAFPKYLRIMAGDAFVGKKAQDLRGICKIKYPIENGLVTNWPEMERIWNHIYSEELKVLSEDHPVLLTEPPLNCRRNREQMAEIFFETFNTPALYVGIQAVLSLYPLFYLRYASGRTTGIVLDSGAGTTHTIPVFEGFALPHAIKRINLSGTEITNHFSLLLKKTCGLTLQTSSELELCRIIKERVCYISLNISKEEKEGKLEEYVLPDGSVVKAPEILFNPDLAGLEYPGIHTLLVSSITKTDMDLRSSLYSNIVLSGGTTLCKGFGDRLLNEVKKLAMRDVKIKITAPPERKVSTWIGGSILASLSTFKKMWVTAEEYQEDPEIVIRKFL